MSYGGAAGPVVLDPKPDVESSLDDREQLLGIGAAAAKAGVSERALRYYQQLGLITPSGRTPGGMRRYSTQDLARVSRIRELQNLLGLNLEEIAVVLDGEDRLAEIREAYHAEATDQESRVALLRDALALHATLRETVQAKRTELDAFLSDLDQRIDRVHTLMAEIQGGQ